MPLSPITPRRRRPGLTAVAWMTSAGAVGLLLSATSCSSPQTSGESHFGSTKAFLRVCEDGECEAGDDCACAVCTVACDNVSDCTERLRGVIPDPSNPPTNIVCRAPLCGEIPPDDDGSSPDSVCEITCETDEDCAFLDVQPDGDGSDDNGHVCRSGACRTQDAPEDPHPAPETVSLCPTGRTLIPGIVAPDGIGFCLDDTEVTVGAYRACVDTGACTETTSGNFLTVGRENHPIEWISVAQAENYCELHAGRLPRRDEWTVAASGGAADVTYPWGDDVPIGTDMPLRACAFSGTSTCTAGSSITGAGPYGHMDLSGNVAELVSDAEDFCAAGGDFTSEAADLSSSSCVPFSAPAATVGFRCVSDL